LIDLQIPDEQYLEILNAQWGDFSLNNKLREFTYKFRNNILGINTRVSHFNENVNRGCTFCAKRNTLPIPDETFVHIFFDCPITKGIINKFCDEMLTEMNLRDNYQKKEFMFIGNTNDINFANNYFLRTVSILLLFIIWEHKLSKKIPVYQTVLNSFFFEMENIRKVNAKLRDNMQLNLALCRDWAEHVSRRR
jgi:hypothetical protein